MTVQVAEMSSGCHSKYAFLTAIRGTDGGLYFLVSDKEIDVGVGDLLTIRVVEPETQTNWACWRAL